MAARCALVIRGGRKPFVVLVKSNIDVEFGDVVPIPTLLFATSRNIVADVNAPCVLLVAYCPNAIELNDPMTGEF